MNNCSPWKEFLDTRLDVIRYFAQMGKSDEQISYELSMTPNQVYAIKKACRIGKDYDEERILQEKTQ